MTRLYAGMTYEQAKSLFLNHYIKLKIRLSGSAKSRGIQFRSAVDDDSIRNADAAEEVLFLSYFDKVFLDHEDQRQFISKVLNVPNGFLAAKGKRSDEPKLSHKEEQETDFYFLAMRSGLLHTFELLRENRNKELLGEWLEHLKATEELSALNKQLITDSANKKEFPKISMTPKIATSSQQRLQYIHLAGELKKLFFSDDSKTKEFIEHRDWLRQFDPSEGTVKGLAVPDRYKEDVVVILAYLLAIDLYNEDQKTMLSFDGIYRKAEIKYKVYLEEANSIIIVNKLVFQTIFFLGIFRKEYSQYFHTSISQNILGFIDEKSYELCYNKNTLELFLKESTESLLATLDKEPEELFKSYSNLVAEKDSIAAKDQDADKVKHLFETKRISQKYAVFFVRSTGYLNFIKALLDYHSGFENIIIVRYLDTDLNSADADKVRADREAAATARQLSSGSRKVQVILRSKFNTDNRDTIKNIQGFFKELNVSDFSCLRYETDAPSEKEQENELMCIIKALHPVPVFDAAEDYFFA